MKNILTDPELNVEMNFEIKPYNIDAAGHVNNAVYIHWLEDLRVKLFEEHFNFKELLEDKRYPVVVSTEIVYKKFLRLFDKPVGCMYLDSSRHGMMILKVKFKLNEKVAAYGTQKCVILDLNNGKILQAQKLKEIFNQGFIK